MELNLKSIYQLIVSTYGTGAVKKSPIAGAYRYIIILPIGI